MHQLWSLVTCHGVHTPIVLSLMTVSYKGVAILLHWRWHHLIVVSMHPNGAVYVMNEAWLRFKKQAWWWVHVCMVSRATYIMSEIIVVLATTVKYSLPCTFPQCLAAVKANEFTFTMHYISWTIVFACSLWSVITLQSGIPSVNALGRAVMKSVSKPSLLQNICRHTTCGIPVFSHVLTWCKHVQKTHPCHASSRNPCMYHMEVCSVLKFFPAVFVAFNTWCEHKSSDLSEAELRFNAFPTSAFNLYTFS